MHPCLELSRSRSISEHSTCMNTFNTTEMGKACWVKLTTKTGSGTEKRTSDPSHFPTPVFTSFSRYLRLIILGKACGNGMTQCRETASNYFSKWMQDPVKNAYEISIFLPNDNSFDHYNSVSFTFLSDFLSYLGKEVSFSLHVVR